MAVLWIPLSTEIFYTNARDTLSDFFIYAYIFLYSFINVFSFFLIINTNSEDYTKHLSITSIHSKNQSLNMETA